MDTLDIRIDLGNDAFNDAAGEYDPASQAVEVARILRKLADQIAEEYELPHSQKLRDSNGNTCGRAAVV